MSEMFIWEFKHKLTPRLQDRLNSRVKLPNSILALAKECLSIYKQMQAIDKIRDRIKPQTIGATPASASMRQVIYFYQRQVTNTRANTSFLRLFSSITGTIILTSQYLDEEQARLMKEGRCFSYKEGGHTTYDCPKKGKITAILEGIGKNSDSQGKK